MKTCFLNFISLITSIAANINGVQYHTNQIQIKTTLYNRDFCVIVDMNRQKSDQKRQPRYGFGDRKSVADLRFDRTRRFLFVACDSVALDKTLWDISEGRLRQTVFKGSPGEKDICIGKYITNDYLRAGKCDWTAIRYNVTTGSFLVSKKNPSLCLKQNFKKLVVGPHCLQKPITAKIECDPPVVPTCTVGVPVETLKNGCPTFECFCAGLQELTCLDGEVQLEGTDVNGCTIIECGCPVIAQPNCGNGSLVNSTINGCDQFSCTINDNPCDNLPNVTCTLPEIEIDSVNQDGCATTECACPDISTSDVTCENGLVIGRNVNGVCPFFECLCPVAVEPDCPSDGVVEDEIVGFGGLNCTMRKCVVDRCDNVVDPVCSGGEVVTSIIINGCPSKICQCPNLSLTSCLPGQMYEVNSTSSCDTLTCSCPTISPDTNCTGQNETINVNGCIQHFCLIEDCPTVVPASCTSPQIAVNVVINECPASECQCPVLSTPSCSSGLVLTSVIIDGCELLECQCPPLEEPACSNGVISSVEVNGCDVYTCTVSVTCQAPDPLTCTNGEIETEIVTNGCYNTTCSCPDISLPSSCASGQDQYDVGLISGGPCETLSCTCHPTPPQPTCSNGILSTHQVDNCDQFKCTKDIICTPPTDPVCGNDEEIVDTVITGCPAKICQCPPLIPIVCDADQLLIEDNSSSCPVLSCACPTLSIPTCTDGTLTLVSQGNCDHYTCTLSNDCTPPTTPTCTGTKQVIDIIVNDCPDKICACPSLTDTTCTGNQQKTIDDSGDCPVVICECPTLIQPTCTGGSLVTTTVNGCDTYDCLMDQTLKCGVKDASVGWSQVGTTRVWFKFFTNKLSMSDARQACKDLQTDSDLASILNAAEQTKLENLGTAAISKLNTWIGGLEIEASLGYSWLDGNGLISSGFDNFGSGMSGGFKAKPCVIAKKPASGTEVGAREWRNNGCGTKLHYICQVRC